MHEIDNEFYACEMVKLVISFGCFQSRIELNNDWDLVSNITTTTLPLHFDKYIENIFRKKYANIIFICDIFTKVLILEDLQILITQFIV